MDRILFLAELYNRVFWEPIYSNTPNTFNRVDNIYYFDTAVNLDSYWVATWGGYFDNVTITDLQILFDVFLTQVTTETALKITDNSFYVDGTKVYFNIPKKPWQYYFSTVEVDTLQSGAFSSGVKDPNNPSDIKYDGKKYKTILNVPSVVNRLSDPISGASLNTTFNYSVDNRDGFFDDTYELNFFNTVTVLKKSVVKNPTLADFKIIRRGIVESAKITFDSFDVKVSDYNRFFTNEICRTINNIEFPNVLEKSLNKKIPIGYGDLFNVPVIEVAKDSSVIPLWIDYIAIEPSWITSVSKVYSSDGLELTNSVTNGIIRVTELDGDGKIIEAQTADITGKTGYTIGSIITELIHDNSFFKYLPENWDTTETNDYITNSYEVGFYFGGGQLKNAINNVLKNDVAFLIVKNNGLLTIRRWGNNYTTHEIENWKFVKKPQKNFDESAKYYITSVNVNYKKNQNDSEKFNATYLNETRKLEIFNEFRKFQDGNFNTDLLNETDANDLSELLLDRFGGLKEDLTLDLAYDMSEVELLDKIKMDVIINNRIFTQNILFIVKEVNPAQDTIVVEAVLNIKNENAMIDSNEDAIMDENDLAIMEI